MNGNHSSKSVACDMSYVSKGCAMGVSHKLNIQLIFEIVFHQLPEIVDIYLQVSGKCAINILDTATITRIYLRRIALVFAIRPRIELGAYSRESTSILDFNISYSLTCGFFWQRTIFR